MIHYFSHLCLFQSSLLTLEEKCPTNGRHPPGQSWRPDSCMDFFAHVFDTWEKKGSLEFSWKTVINVLENPLLEERSLAQKVREMITTVNTIC